MAKILNVSQSRTKMFRRCQKQYSFRYDYAKYYDGPKNSEMVPKVKKLAFYRGSWMHALQEALHHQWAGFDEFEMTFGEGKQKLTFTASTWRDVQEILSGSFNELFDEEKEDLGDLPAETERMFKSYLRFWKADQDTYSVALLPDGKPAIECIVDVPLDELGLPGVRFKGRIDLVVEDDEYGGNWIWDAKWVKSVPEPDERMMSPQNPLYKWAFQKMYGIPIEGFVYNYGRTKAPTVPRVLQRPAGMLSLAAKMDSDYSTYLQAVKDNHGADWKNFIPYYHDKLRDLKARDGLWFRRERIPVDDARTLRALREYVATVHNIQEREKRRDYVPRTYLYNCKFKSGSGCEYHDLCVAEFSGLEIQPLVKAGFMFAGERYGKEEDLLNG